MLYSNPHGLNQSVQSLAASQTEAGQPFALRDLLNSAFYHRRAALMVLGAVIAVGVLAALVMPIMSSCR